MNAYCCYGGCYGYLTFITDSAGEGFLSCVCSNVFLDIANLIVVAMGTYFCHGGCYGYLLLLWMPSLPW